jgi:hypothetical protein
MNSDVALANGIISHSRAENAAVFSLLALLLVAIHVSIRWRGTNHSVMSRITAEYFFRKSKNPFVTVSSSPL